MKVLLLLAGRSRRFWPLSEKSFFPICGTTLLDEQIKRLQEAGVTEIVLVGGEHNLRQAKDRYRGMTLIEQEDLDLGMRGALLSALPLCGPGPVMIVSSNDVIEPGAYKELIKSAEGKGGALLAQKVEKYFPGGYLSMEGKRITGIVEKPGEGKEPSDLVNIVAHVHSSAPVLLEALQNVRTKQDDGYEQALDVLFTEHEYVATPYEGLWQAVKFPWHVLELLPVLLNSFDGRQIHHTAQIHDTAVISGDVVIEEGVKVMAHASVAGPCYLGKNVIIANNALARGSSIGDNSVVGYATEVKGSVLHSHVWTHMTYIGDSIIGRNVSFGAGSVTGNLRLDEGVIDSAVHTEKVSTGLKKFGAVVGDDCRFGIHTSINPGIKIGSGSFISSGTLITEDIPEKQFVRMKNGHLKMNDNESQAPAPEKRGEYRKKV